MTHVHIIRRVALTVLGLCAWSAAISSAEDESATAGVVDVHANRSGETRNVTAAYWGDRLSMGVDADFVNSDISTSSLGAYYRHALEQPGSEWVVGANVDIDANKMNSHEFQFQHRLSKTFGYGAGIAKLPNDDQDIWFAKLVFAKQFGWTAIEVNPQVQSVNGKAKLGLHLIHFSDNYLAGMGHDGEQWRAVVGFVTPDSDKLLRPAAEIFTWSSDVGRIPGDELVFVNGTLRYTGGFLSNAGRMGRALGAGGVFFYNPISYLSLGWNRTPNIWEIGDLWNVRWVDNKSNEFGAETSVQTAIFPGQLVRAESKWDGIFVGYESTSALGVSEESVMLGYFQKYERYSFGLSVQQATSGSHISVSMGFRVPIS